MSAQRDSSGRFIDGWQGGPGRPKREVEETYLIALRETVTPAKWQAVIDRAIEDATSGDARAREWLSRHLVGRAIARDVNTPNEPQRPLTFAEKKQALKDRIDRLTVVREPDDAS